MYAIQVAYDAGKPRLFLVEQPDPEPGPEDVLITVRATALNRADLLQARGLYPPPPGSSTVLGLEVAGEILTCGDRVVGWKRGDRVFTILAGGGYATRVVAPAATLMTIPDRFSDEEAAAIPEAWLTAWQLLHDHGRLQSGESVLIHAGASGVGLAAIQIASLNTDRIYVTAGSDEKIEACRRYGAQAGLNYRKATEFDLWIRNETRHMGIDIVLDCVGGKYFAKNMESLAHGGRYVLYGIMGGASSELSLSQILLKNLTIIGTTLRFRSKAEKATLTTSFVETILPHLASGRMKPVIFTTLPLEQADHAHGIMRRNENIGKIVLTVPYE